MKKYLLVCTALTLCFGIAGCSINKNQLSNTVQQSQHWMDDNDFLVTDKTDFSLEIFNNMEKPPIGTVLSRYEFNDKQNSSNIFLPTAKLNSQTEFLNLLIESYKLNNKDSYIQNAKLIGDNLVKKSFSSKVNSYDATFIPSNTIYVGTAIKWREDFNTIYTKDQLKAAYSLLRLYSVLNEPQYLDTALNIIKSQINISKMFDDRMVIGALPYSYELSDTSENLKIYKPNLVFPLSLSKIIYELCTLANKITNDNEYIIFRDKNSNMLLENIKSLTLNKPEKKVYNGLEYIEKDRYVIVNRNKDSWDKNNNFNSEEMLETLIALSYTDKDKATEFRETVKNLGIHSFSKGSVTFDKYPSPYTKTDNEEYDYDYLSSILRLEFLINIENDENYICNTAKDLITLIETDKKDKNIDGALRRLEHTAVIDVETTSYFFNLLLKNNNNINKK